MVDKDYMKPVLLSWQNKTLKVLSGGNHRDGMSQMAKSLTFSRLSERFAYKLFVLDPKSGAKEGEFV